ncbi:LptE family protein [Pedobacter sp. KR3-3]|uniref:LptE family protein n=1 Tax=Pedobacter albus TaxID=3113905 RepID=A0ABU7I9R6_9SPHI|nr:MULTISPECIES: LptE family protein [unclassified Pedobacter]MEE1946102.1 LptE family protein [Pedobacter sp. KR3-3]
MKKLIFFLVVLLVAGCGYKFNGASTEGLKTVYVKYIENNAPLVEPTLSQTLTEDLKERIRNQSRLVITQNTDADAVFEGRITGYEIKPIAIQDNTRPVAGANRLTITVSMKYINNVDTGKRKQSFDEVFTAFTDFSLSGQTLASQQQKLIKEVNVKLTENIFNRAFAQW